MHRKLIHSVRALGIALSLLTASLILAIPANGPGGLAAAADAAPASAGVQADAGAAKAYSPHRRTRTRDAMALPFFSFAQGLRRGNRS